MAKTIDFNLNAIYNVIVTFEKGEINLIDLKELRNSKGMSQQELAEECGVIRQTISNIECGLSNHRLSWQKNRRTILEFEWTLFFEE